jgi:multiple sugar transport system substrate-binding protein
MLSNDAQIAYATTEGYAPVTSKAQNSQEYKDYFSKMGEMDGEDSKKYYHVKLKATKLLMDNTENTFITPVFNGSTSLRNTAGQLIEEVAKTVRRGGKIDEAYLDELYENMSITYHLDELSGKKEFGKMPTCSVILLIVLAVIWIFIGAFAIFERKKRKITD